MCTYSRVVFIFMLHSYADRTVIFSWIFWLPQQETKKTHFTSPIPGQA